VQQDEGEDNEKIQGLVVKNERKEEGEISVTILEQEERIEESRRTNQIIYNFIICF
jgi:hypothetical protein